VDGRSDQYSLAVVGFKMLTGTLPFRDESIQAVLYKKLFEDPPWVKDLRDDIPDFIAEALHTALAREPEHRFPSMESFATALWPEHPVGEPSGARISAGRASRASIDAATTQIDHDAAGSSTRRRRRGRVTAAAVIVFAGGFVGAWYVVYAGRDSIARNDSALVAVPTVSQDTQAVPLTGDLALVDSTMLVAEAPADDDVQQEEPRSPAQPNTMQPGGAPPPAAEQRRVEPRAGRPAVSATGYVTLNAVPFATIWIDNVEVQDTPLHRRELAAGQHVIELRREGFETIIDTVVVTAGNEMRKSYTLVPKP